MTYYYGSAQDRTQDPAYMESVNPFTVVNAHDHMHRTSHLVLCLSCIATAEV